MIAEDRAARIVHRLLPPGEATGWEEFERRLSSQAYPRWNWAVGFVADQIRAACKIAVEQELITGKILRGDIDADTAKELDAMRWQEEYEHEQGLLDEEPDFGSLIGLDARAASLEQRVTALESRLEA